ncbi:MAG: hypothetical protein WCW52_10220 [Elusimicrobiales bacterium]|jgi:hypothetical protein
MDAGRTDKLIAEAIAALPYRSPSAGFSDRVMAGIAAAAKPRSWAVLPAAAGLTVAAWAAALVLVSARPVYSGLAEFAALLIQPGGFFRALHLLAANAALVLVKLAKTASFAVELLNAAAPVLPAWYEAAAAALLCCAAMIALSGSGGVSVQKAGSR